MSRVDASPLEDTGSQRRGGVQVISRAALILRLIAREQMGLTLSEVVTATGLAKSTAYRILQALAEEEIVEQFGGRFRIGSLLRSTAMSDSEDVRLRARPFMEQLASDLQETVDLGVLVGDQVMIVEQMRWVRELTAGADVGSLLPALRTASGRALMACLPTWREYALTRSDTDGSSLLAELTRIRRSKVAVVEDGVHLGIAGIATFVVSGERAFALGVPVPTVRFAREVAHLRRVLLEVRPEFERIVAGR
jgi:DNA-binding IclR family transcriptional regulator